MASGGHEVENINQNEEICEMEMVGITQNENNTKQDGFTKVTRNKRHMSPGSEARAAQEKRSRPSRPQKMDSEEGRDFNLVYMKGTKTNITTISPFKLKKELENQAGQVHKIEKAGTSLRIYCYNIQQKDIVYKINCLDKKSV